MASEQFVFMSLDAPSNDNGFSFDNLDLSSVSGNVVFTVGDLLDSGDASDLMVVQGDADARDYAAEYETFSSSVMFVFGEASA